MVVLLLVNLQASAKLAETKSAKQIFKKFTFNYENISRAIIYSKTDIILFGG
jgi:hypothetical protein